MGFAVDKADLKKRYGGLIDEDLAAVRLDELTSDARDVVICELERRNMSVPQTEEPIKKAPKRQRRPVAKTVVVIWAVLASILCFTISPLHGVAVAGIAACWLYRDFEREPTEPLARALGVLSFMIATVAVVRSGLLGLLVFVALSVWLSFNKPKPVRMSSSDPTEKVT
jgi:hypothetical protein